MIRSLFSRQHRLNRQLMDEVGGSPSQHPRLEEVRRLIDAGADVNYSEERRTILGMAGRSPWCSADIVRLLLERGADVDGTQRPDLNPPIVIACHQSDNERLRLLVDAGADLNAIDMQSRRMALTELTSWADPEIVEHFLKHGADPNRANWRHGYKPLHMAALRGRADLAALFIRYGADVSAQDENGFTPIDLAENRGLDKRADWLPDEVFDEFVRTLRAAGGGIAYPSPLPMDHPPAPHDGRSVAGE